MASRRTSPGNEAAARKLYRKMIATMRKAASLYYESDYTQESVGLPLHRRCRYRVWMRKPNYIRVEVTASDNKEGGVLIGDGKYLWMHWPNERDRWYAEDEGLQATTNAEVYMKQPARAGKYSVSHQAVLLGGGMGQPILEPSTFYGYIHPLAAYMDGIRGAGTQIIAGEPCDGIEISIMDGQRRWFLWLSRKDTLPRKLREVVRVSDDVTTEELWSNVELDGEIPLERFRWAPPEGWEELSWPQFEGRLLKPGRQAPDFDFVAADGTRGRLSDALGKVVWLTFWRVGCPPCREEMPYLEKLHRRYKDKGLTVLGYNAADDKGIATDFLRQKGVTFPNVIDSSSEARETALRLYRSTGVPTNYLIDPRGKIAAAWFGYKKGDPQGIKALRKLGLK